jgi:hypothetical protein
LPARLGTTTGSDATLFIGGWGYLTRQRANHGEGIAEAIVAIVLVLTVVGLLIAASDHSHHGATGHSHGGGGHASLPHAPSGHGSLPHPSGGHVAAPPSRALAHLHFLAHATRAVARTVDAFGRVAIHASLAGADWEDDPSLPHDGRQSQLYLEMTLVDNRTGLTLWHAHQRFPASAERDDELDRAVDSLLDTLPDRPAAPPPSVQEEEHGDPGHADVEPGQPSVARDPAVQPESP